MRHLLTDTSVKRLPIPPKGNKVYFDTRVSGFGLRVTANGARAFVLNYFTRANRRERRITIGDTDTWSVASARERARELQRLVDNGGDPLAEIETERAAPTVNYLVDRYVLEHLPRKRPRSRIEDERLLPIIRAALGQDKVADIGFTDIDKLHRDVTRERGPFRANRVIALLSKMLALAVKWGYRVDNPCKAVERNPEPKRSRYLSPEEIGRLMAALDTEEDKQAADIIRLLLLTGARSAEVLTATWNQFDLEAGLWTKPHAATKQKEEHRLPLADEAVALLKRLATLAQDGRKAPSRHQGATDGRPKNGRYVFPGKTALAPRKAIRHAWERVIKAAGLADVRIHDLRHTHASLLVNSGYSLPVIGGLLGHKTVQTTARYAHLSDDTLRNAAKSVGKVVAFKRGAK